MNDPTRNRTIAAGLLVLLFAIGGCRSASAPAAHASLQPGVEPLRSQFNGDTGHTRIVVLAAPT